MQKEIVLFLILLSCLSLVQPRWTQEQAATWYDGFSWGAGVNYTPAYAANEIQFWEKLDLDVIDKQLKWAHELGFSKLRVFLHVAPYLKNSTQYLKDVFEFLAVAKSRGHHVIPVLFDDCWRGEWQGGAQPEPIPGLHNSQWVQCPGTMAVEEQALKKYVTDIVKTFRNSESIAFWDLYNQVGNSGKTVQSLPFLKKVFEWARSADPSQPLTSGWWNGGAAFDPINQFILSQSDIITFHAYCDVQCTKEAITRMSKKKRPVVCTEYMARQMDSKFVTHLPMFKELKVWAINWGFVFGRTQTYYPWWSKEGDPIPDVWFHDVLKPDGTPFNRAETDFIRNVTKVSTGQVILEA